MCLENPYLHPYCLLYFYLIERGAVQWQREGATGGWTQFDWMLDGDSFKAQPIEFWVFCFQRKPIDVSDK